jgi:hypothetical protein
MRPLKGEEELFYTGGWSIGAMPTIGKKCEDIKGGLFINVECQFQQLMLEAI